MGLGIWSLTMCLYSFFFEFFLIVFFDYLNILGFNIIMPTINRFEELEIWQLARKLSARIYPLTFIAPIASDYRFTDQIRGTCGSIMDNIAEGFGRGSRLEFINSLTIAKGETEELKSQLYRGSDVHYLEKTIFSELFAEADLLVKKIGSFINYLNKSKVKGQKFKNRSP
ncbi:MAG: four helix bundle protein [Flavisolibacter sp.]